jgi:hypothetical protein
VVAQNVAGTDDHETGRTLTVMRSHRYLRVRRDAKGKAAFSSNSKLMPDLHWNESKKMCARSNTARWRAKLQLLVPTAAAIATASSTVSAAAIARRAGVVR